MNCEPAVSGNYLVAGIQLQALLRVLTPRYIPLNNKVARTDKKGKVSNKINTMAKLIFKLRNVPEDEALEVRELLESNGIEYFETFAGSWGMSMPALWVKDNDQYQHARELIEAYSKDRSNKIKTEYELLKARGEAKTMWDNFVDDPFRFIAYMIGVSLVLYFSLRFFLTL